MPSLQTAYNYMVHWCNSTDPYCGYSQNTSLRCGGVSGGVKYFDCSGMIACALTAGGFFKNNPCFATGEEPDYLRRAGFVQVPVDGEWKPGDILWRRRNGSGHTEMVYSGRVTMGAHTARYTLDRQVSINTYNSKPSEWMRCYRYGELVAPGEAVGPYDEWDSWDFEHNGPGEGWSYARFGGISDYLRRVVIRYGQK